MGGLRKYMPITWLTSLVGSLALIGTPFFSGFYSKDSIIAAVKESHITVSGFAYFAVMAGVFITAFYSFRMYFLVFHGEERFGKAHHDGHAAHDDAHHHGLAPGQKPHETPWVVWLPLVLLAIPSALIGYFAIEPMLYGGYFGQAIQVNHEVHPVMEELGKVFGEVGGANGMALHAATSPVFWLAAAGVFLAWVFYLKRPEIPKAIRAMSGPLYTLLENKYYFDKFNEVVVAGGARLLGTGFWKGGDVGVIDGLIVGGATTAVSILSLILRFFQSGHVYQYAFVMILGVCGLLTLLTYPTIIAFINFVFPV